MSVQSLEIQNKKNVEEKVANLELVVNNQQDENYAVFSINNRCYLGNKYKLNQFIEKVLTKECGKFDTFADLFAGTGSVASIFQDKHLIVNDILYSNYACHQTWFGTEKYSNKKIVSVRYVWIIYCNMSIRYIDKIYAE